MSHRVRGNEHLSPAIKDLERDGARPVLLQDLDTVRNDWLAPWPNARIIPPATPLS